MNLYAWQPQGHGEYSFFVTAASEDEARKAVDSYIAEHAGKDHEPYLPRDAASDFALKDYYILTVLEPGQVITNAND